MKITFERSGFDKVKADAYLFLCYEDKKLFDEQIKYIQRILKTKITELNLEDFKGKTGQAALIYTNKCRIILSGLGKKENVTIEKIRVGVSRILKKAISLKIKKVAVEILNDVSLPGGITEVARAEAIGCILGNYHFTKYYTSKDQKEQSSIKQAVFFADKQLMEKYSKELEKGIKTGSIIGDATNFARDLGNEPSNVLFPESYCNILVEKSKESNYTTEVLLLEDIKKLGMGAVLEVAKGSEHEPRFMIMRYNGGDEGEKPYVVIGKGVTFDSGGISLKPPAGMAMMKLDMCGSAAVAGIFDAVSKLGLKINLVGLIPMVENMPDGNSLKPGDVITAYNGKTIEIDNTDAEGRLILADALSYAAEFKPRSVIDMATLTGAVIVALGNVTSAVMGNNQDLIDKLSAAGNETYDRVWQLPLFEEYDKLIDSDIADVKNGGTGRQAGTITAGMFLQRFIGNYPWAHIDIAGTAMRDSKQDFLPKYATGAGVRLVTQYLINEEKEAQNA
ncbi:MAG TPA: leucyl aminopeptidase [Ignavibacteria bacterium]|nr:leucyl aminopeptidase [Ignavibacteria bacterium]